MATPGGRFKKSHTVQTQLKNTENQSGGRNTETEPFPFGIVSVLYKQELFLKLNIQFHITF